MGINSNNRIFWAVQGAGVAADGTSSFTAIHGLQSIGITTTFNLEQIFELGQIAIYENVEDIPDIEITMEKVIDGYPLIYHLCTPNATSATLAGRSTDKAIVALSIFPDVQDSASGDPNAQVTMSGLYVSTLNYNFPVDGSATESVTLVGNHKLWSSGSFTFTGGFTNDDTPLALQIANSGGVQQREDVIFGESLMPAGNGGIIGISSSGTNDKANGQHQVHFQNISFSTDLGRDNLNELGTRTPFFRYVNFPVEVTSEFEVLTKDGDWISATEDGVAGNGNNLFDQEIKLVMREGTQIYLGTSNKLQNVSYGGGDAGGGNSTASYTYTTFNEMTVTHPQDPAGLSA